MAFKNKDVRSILMDESLELDAKVKRLLDLAHSEIDAVKDERDELQAKLAKAETDLTAANEAKAKADKDFTDYKTEQTNRETRAAKETAYKQLLANAGIADKYVNTVLKATNLDEVELTKDGLKNADKLTEDIKSNWADFCTQTQGANVSAPPNTNNTPTVTKEQFEKMSYKQRLELYNSQPELYNSLKN